METYEPIACAFHDILLHFSSLNEEVDLVYLVDNRQKEIRIRIMDVFTRNREEFLLTDTNMLIRLDQIISVNEHVLTHYC